MHIHIVFLFLFLLSEKCWQREALGCVSINHGFLLLFLFFFELYSSFSLIKHWTLVLFLCQQSWKHMMGWEVVIVMTSATFWNVQRFLMQSIRNICTEKVALKERCWLQLFFSRQLHVAACTLSLGTEKRHWHSELNALWTRTLTHSLIKGSCGPWFAVRPCTQLRVSCVHKSVVIGTTTFMAVFLYMHRHSLVIMAYPTRNIFLFVK